MQDPKTKKPKQQKKKEREKKFFEKKIPKKKIKEKLFIKKQKTLTNTNTSRPMHFDTDRSASKLRERKVDWEFENYINSHGACS